MDYKTGYEKNFEYINNGTDFDYIKTECFYCGYSRRNSSSWQKCEICPFKKNNVKKYVVKI